MKSKNIIIIGILLICLILLVELLISYDNNQGKLKLYFFNAGKADSCLIYDDYFSVLIDTGEEELGEEILQYLETNKITKLDYLIITHFDKDHVGSAYKIINNIEVSNVIQSNYPKDSKVYANYLESLENKNIIPLTLRDNMSFNFEDVYFNIDAPNVEIYSDNKSNNSSLIISMKYKNNSFLFMGDAQDLRIKEYINDNSDNYDFLKIPYHGHYQETLDELLNIVKPKSAVITSSLKELEDSRTLDLLKSRNVDTYLTRNGSILLSSDGNNIKIKQ